MSAELIKQQQEFAAALRTQTSPDPTLLQTTPQGEPARFHIYQHAYRIRMIEALKENYPVLARVLGDDDFATLADGFLQSCPSQTASIRWYGARLAAYVETNLDALPHPALLDLIRMEWALSVAFDSPDAAALTVDDLSTVSPGLWPTLHLTAQPSVQVLDMEWNVEPIWTALAADPDADTDAPQAARHHLLIWRSGHVNQWRSMPEQEAALLDALMQGRSFGEICEYLATQTGPDQDAASTVARYLRVWVESGLLLPLD